MRVKLKQAFDLQMGKTPARNVADYWNGCYSWVSIADLGNISNKYIVSTREKITDRGIADSKIKIVPKGTVIMSFKLSIGKTAITSEDMYTNEAIIAFHNRGIYNIDTEYLYYFCCGTDWGIGTNKAVMGLTLNKKTLSEREIEIPDIALQRKVVARLNKIDAIINRRRQQLQELDRLVKSRFIELFGTETEMGRWETTNVGDVADVCVGVVIKPSQYYCTDGIPAFRSLNIGKMQVKDSDWVFFTPEGHQKNQKSVIRENDVLVVRSGAPGTACVATEKYDGFNAIDIIIAHPDTSRVNSVFLAMFTNMPHGMNQIQEKTGGAAQQHFNVGGYKSLQMILPPMAMQEQFAVFVEQTDKSKYCSQKFEELCRELIKIYEQEWI